MPDSENEVAKHLRIVLANNISSKNHCSTLMKKKAFNEKTHRSIKLINNTFSNAVHVFLFNFTLDKISKEIDRLNRKKAVQTTDIPNKVVNESKDLTSFYGYHNLTTDYQILYFQQIYFKYADVKPTY